MATRDEVYQKFGITAEAAQLFETEIGTMLLSLKGIESNWRHEGTQCEKSRFLYQMNKSTLGGLLKSVQKRIGNDNLISISEGLIEQFQRALEARNLLSHGFYERHNFKIQTELGRDEIIDDLEILHVDLFNAWQVASKINEYIGVHILGLGDVISTVK